MLAVSSLAACGWRTHSLQQDGALAERGLCMERGPPLPHLLGCVGSRWRRSPPGPRMPKLAAVRLSRAGRRDAVAEAR